MGWVLQNPTAATRSVLLCMTTSVSFMRRRKVGPKKLKGNFKGNTYMGIIHVPRSALRGGSKIFGNLSGGWVGGA